ncbi:uncharacterized protein LOC119914300 [Micropterus salmoides]|uniref:uncharacterized protein LOC119914300 n=1 Tax=Micropterus salmoides TaxID=27706 RepID=UPI0018EBFA58|nr:uncharacterized protein LOC119914300 [Micropterus salmoides]
MDIRTVVTISALLLTTAESVAATSWNNSTAINCSCPTATSTITTAPTSSPTSPPPALGLFNITWIRCTGNISLIFYNASNISFSSSPVCFSNHKKVHSLLGNVCVNKKGCKDTVSLKEGTQQNGYNMIEGRAEEGNCLTLQVQCKDEGHADVPGPLHAYKVVTALLCCVLLVLLLIRFTRPTVKALQKRLSDRRQNRWIGPTQSHSVSYHRGKAAFKHNDGEKRQSYPALERLAVSDSREPSSTRNSGYNF